MHSNVSPTINPKPTMNITWDHNNKHLSISGELKELLVNASDRYCKTIAISRSLMTI